MKAKTLRTADRWTASGIALCRRRTWSSSAVVIVVVALENFEEGRIVDAECLKE